MNRFDDCFSYSLGQREKFDESLLKGFIPHCVDVVKTQEDDDKQGVDYHAILDDGSVVTIDAKTRKPGAKRFWNHGEPELAIERYSVVETRKVGWLFKKGPVHPEYILYTFDREDTDRFFVIPFQLLRKAVADNGKRWAEMFGIKTQANEGSRLYHSDAVFVPASMVIDAIAREMVQSY